MSTLPLPSLPEETWNTITIHDGVFRVIASPTGEVLIAWQGAATITLNDDDDASEGDKS
jgi:hypothetical protein